MRKYDKSRIIVWPPALLVRRKEKNLIGLRKRKITFGCDHKDLPLLHLLVSDTGTLIHPLTNDMCPACFQSFMVKRSTVCAGCGDLILPRGEAVGLINYDYARKDGLVPERMPPIMVNGEKYAAFHHDHLPGMFSGNWTEAGYIPHDWKEEPSPNGETTANNV